MTDDERDARIETLTDAIADTNRAVAETSRIAAETSRVVASLAGETAFLQRLMRTHLVVDHGYDLPDGEPGDE